MVVLLMLMLVIMGALLLAIVVVFVAWLPRCARSRGLLLHRFNRRSGLHLMSFSLTVNAFCSAHTGKEVVSVVAVVVNV